MSKRLLFILSLITLFVLSCRKDSFITSRDAQIGFSTDTLFFDTVFTTTGSITEPVKIYNRNNQKLRITDVRLMGGAQSMYKINIDGAAGPESDGIELEANDSLYVFVAIRIDPSGANLPFVVQDSIEVSFNGNRQYIQLQAWGQNAHFLRDQRIEGQVSWNNDLPYVILGSLQVDTNALLTIGRGCKIYFHADAPLLVDGSLQVQGDKDDSMRVQFLGDRLDEPYRYFPGSWPGIFFRSTSKDNTMQYAVIRNAYQGIVAEDVSINANPKLVLDRCIIDNIYDAGILGAQSDIRASNCLISNCGKNIVLGYGGHYDFTNCTIASFSNDYVPHKDPVLNVSNYVLQGNTALTADLHASFLNCIFWGSGGSVDDEVVVSKQGTGIFQAGFSHCLWKVANTPSDISSDNILSNLDPLFDSVNIQRRYYDLRLQPSSPAIGQGADAGLTPDLDGYPRMPGQVDLGSYQHQ